MLNNINWLDILFLILLLGTVYKGSKTGVGGQLPSILCWFLLVFISVKYYDLLSEALFGFMLQKWARPVSFFAISCIVITGIKILEKVTAVISEDDISYVEKIGGAVVGAFRAALLFGLIGMFMLLLPVDFLRSTVTDGSYSCMHFVKMNAKVYNWINEIAGMKFKGGSKNVVNSFIDSVHT